MCSVPLPPIRAVWALQTQQLGRGYQETTVPCFLEFYKYSSNGKCSLEKSLNRVKVKAEQIQESRKFTFSK